MTNYASSLALTAVTNHSIALDVPFPVMKGQRVFYSAVLLCRVLKATAKGEVTPTNTVNFKFHSIYNNNRKWWPFNWYIILHVL